jgi:hypothetical protein
MFTLRMLPAVLLTFGLLTVAAGDDKDKGDKKSKIPPLTFIGNIEGEIAGVDTGSDRLTVSFKKLVRQPVPVVGPQRLIGGGIQYRVTEQMVHETYNLSPDLKIRLMNKRPEPSKQDKKKPDPKSTGKKDTKKEDKETTDENADKGKEDKPEKDHDARLGGAPGKKNQLSKGQFVRVALGRNNDPVNPQIYAMVVYVISDGK